MWKKLTCDRNSNRNVLQWGDNQQIRGASSSKFTEWELKVGQVFFCERGGISLSWSNLFWAGSVKSQSETASQWVYPWHTAVNRLFKFWHLSCGVNILHLDIIRNYLCERTARVSHLWQSWTANQTKKKTHSDSTVTAKILWAPNASNSTRNVGQEKRTSVMFSPWPELNFH